MESDKPTSEAVKLEDIGIDTSVAHQWWKEENTNQLNSGWVHHD